MGTELDRAIRAVVRDCLGVAAGDEVLVVCNPATRGLGEALAAEALEAGGDAVLAVMEERATHAAEPPASIAAAMAAADVVLAPTVQSLSHTEARSAATAAGVRLATLPGVTEEMLARVMSADMEGLRRKGAAVAETLENGSEVRITSAAGTDLRLGIEGRHGIPDAGDLTTPAGWGNLPCGEGFIAPLEETAEGTLVVDGSIAAIGLVEEPATLTISGGHLTAAEGEAGERLLELLSAHGPDGTNVAELGIGTNEKAILTGEVLEDEKILGTVHVAFGASAGIGGTVSVPIHLDVVVTDASLEIDGQQVLDAGRYVLGEDAA